VVGVENLPKMGPRDTEEKKLETSINRVLQKRDKEIRLVAKRRWRAKRGFLRQNNSMTVC
jgi:hypothetical protein